MRGKFVIRIVGLILGTAVGGFLLWHVAQGLDFLAAVQHGAEIRVGWVVLALAAATTLLYLTACEWKLFLPPDNSRW